LLQYVSFFNFFTKFTVSLPQVLIEYRRYNSLQSSTFKSGSLSGN
jgi:hypothetical protein